MNSFHDAAAERLDEQIELPLLGVPVQFRGSAALIAVANRAFGRWAALPLQAIAPGPPALVELAIGPPAEPDLPGELLQRCHGDTLLAAIGTSLAMAQPAAGKALAIVTPALAADEPRLQRTLLEPLGLLATVGRDRTPLRAAAVARAGRAALLVGADAAARATLCYACLRAGVALLADETVYLSTAGRPRAWGHAAPLLLPAVLLRRFPELARHPRLPDGGVAVEPHHLAPSTLHAEVAVICLLERGAGQASQAARLEADAALEPLIAAQDLRLALLRDRAPEVAAALGACAFYRLSLGSDPTNAAALLAHLLLEQAH